MNETLTQSLQWAASRIEHLENALRRISETSAADTIGPGWVHWQQQAKDALDALPVCERCLGRTSLLSVVADNDSHDHILVCDTCLKSISEWAPQTTWSAAVDGDECVLWSRPECSGETIEC